MWGFFCGECADVVVVGEPTTEGVEVWPCACSVACKVPDSRVPETKKAVVCWGRGREDARGSAQEQKKKKAKVAWRYVRMRAWLLTIIMRAR